MSKQLSTESITFVHFNSLGLHLSIFIKKERKNSDYDAINSPIFLTERGSARYSRIFTLVFYSVLSGELRVIKGVQHVYKYDIMM